jgi:hypothetical protein
MIEKVSQRGSGRKLLKKRLVSVFFILAFLVVVFLFIDFVGPSKITVSDDKVFGLECLRARDLIVQEYDKDGNLWASRGMKIYMLEKGSRDFKRIAHVPTGLTILWLRDFSIVRWALLRPECIEMTVAGNGDIHALSAGRMWLRKSNSKKFIETHRLEHYGFGDQGIRNDGILSVNENTIYLGEYFQNPDRTSVNILKNSGDGIGWTKAYAFQPGQIRHIHALQKDPFTDSLWVCTGDSDEESMIARSGDGFMTINKLGEGSQLWRVCQLVFTKDEVIWGTDNGDEEIAGIYGWNRRTSELKKYCSVPGAIFFATSLQGGTIVMSTNRERMANEKDDKVRLYIKPEGGDIKVVECGTWNHNKPGFWYKYAMLRFQRYQGGPALAFTCLNQKELPDSELIIVSEESLLKAGVTAENNKKK